MPRVSQGRSNIAHAMIGLSTKQSRFVEAYVHDPTNASKAVIQAGYDTTNPDVIASQNLSKPSIQSAIIAILNNHNVNNERIAQKISQGLDATKLDHSYTSEDVEVPDHSIQYKYTELSCRLLNLIGNDASTSMTPTVTINSDKLMILLQSASTPGTTVPASTTPTGEEKQK